MEYTLTATTTVDASPARVFAQLIDIEHLPDWNLEIPKVVSTPDVLAVGSEWKVEIHALGTRWVSRSEVVDLDRASRRFGYRSQSDDGNPSFAEWCWEVTPEDGGSRVVVQVGVHPRTFLRKRFLARFRRPSLRRAVHESLASLRELVRSIEMGETT